MIHVVKPEPPEVLRTRGAIATRDLCADHEAGSRTFKFNKAIYAAKQVKDTLISAQHRKCAFCESFFTHTGYGDVEHFRPKAGYKQRETDELKCPGYYWLAYAWDNLLFSCQICNQRFKRNLFPIRDGRRRARSHHHKLELEQPLLIDPTLASPSEFLEFKEEYVGAIRGCLEGETTIKVLGLNHEDLVEERRKRLENLKDLVRLCDLLRRHVASSSDPSYATELYKHEQKLLAKKDANSEYVAMSRAFLSSIGV
jgi:uncharacterized protein (TIGR02646 family)